MINAKRKPSFTTSSRQYWVKSARTKVNQLGAFFWDFIDKLVFCDPILSR